MYDYFRNFSDGDLNLLPAGSSTTFANTSTAAQSVASTPKTGVPATNNTTTLTTDELRPKTETTVAAAKTTTTKPTTKEPIAVRSSTTFANTSTVAKIMASSSKPATTSVKTSTTTSSTTTTTTAIIVTKQYSCQGKVLDSSGTPQPWVADYSDITSQLALALAEFLCELLVVLLRLGPNPAFREATITCVVLTFYEGSVIAETQVNVTFNQNTTVLNDTSSDAFVQQLTEGSQTNFTNGTSPTQGLNCSRSYASCGDKQLAINSIVRPFERTTANLGSTITDTPAVGYYTDTTDKMIFTTDAGLTWESVTTDFSSVPSPEAGITDKESTMSDIGTSWDQSTMTATPAVGYSADNTDKMIITTDASLKLESVTTDFSSIPTSDAGITDKESTMSEIGTTWNESKITDTPERGYSTYTTDEMINMTDASPISDSGTTDFNSRLTSDGGITDNEFTMTGMRTTYDKSTVNDIYVYSLSTMTENMTSLAKPSTIFDALTSSFTSSFSPSTNFSRFLSITTELIATANQSTSTTTPAGNQSGYKICVPITWSLYKPLSLSIAGFLLIIMFVHIPTKRNEIFQANI
ncbi:unnamed protein product [Schistocephalus solidus]|uniref:SEA domain-containing protein n=1 Tax=Schistocephalus solidus TaxID=70667 RepID=A0A183TAY8_SCHSO|nr:unnamed protein product [Schistocephalus solidus]